MINRPVLFLAIVLSLTACSSSKNTAEDPDYPIANGIWQKQQVIVDGSDKEWDKSSLSFDLGSKVSYEITNDDTNLYVLITTIDRTSQTKILRAGMSVYIDPAAKNRETEAVNFPLESGDAENRSLDAAAQQGQPGDKPDLQQMRAKALISANQYILSGFSKGSGGYGINEQNAAGISLKLNIDSSGEMVYEAVIPLRSLTQKALGRAGSPISVGIKINALPKPAMSSGGGGGYSGGGGGMRGGGGGMRGGGMGGGGMRGGGMGGGGMRGDGGRGSGGNYAASQLLYKEVKFWKRTMIVQKA